MSNRPVGSSANTEARMCRLRLPENVIAAVMLKGPPCVSSVMWGNCAIRVSDLAKRYAESPETLETHTSLWTPEALALSLGIAASDDASSLLRPGPPIGHNRTDPEKIRALTHAPDALNTAIFHGTVRTRFGDVPCMFDGAHRASACVVKNRPALVIDFKNIPEEFVIPPEIGA